MGSKTLFSMSLEQEEVLKINNDELNETILNVDKVVTESENMIREHSATHDVMELVVDQIEENQQAIAENKVDVDLIKQSNETLAYSLGLLGADKNQVSKFKISKEGYSTKIEKLTVSTESLKSILNKIVEFIKDLWNKIIDWFKKVWLKLKVWILQLLNHGKTCERKLRTITNKYEVYIKNETALELLKDMHVILRLNIDYQNGVDPIVSNKSMTLEHVIISILNGIDFFTSYVALNPDDIDTKTNDITSIVKTIHKEMDRWCVDTEKINIVYNNNNEYLRGVTYFSDKEIGGITDTEKDLRIGYTKIPAPYNELISLSNDLIKVGGIDYININNRASNGYEQLLRLAIRTDDLKNKLYTMVNDIEKNRKIIVDKLSELNTNLTKDSMELVNIIKVYNTQSYFDRINTLIYCIKTIIKFFNNCYKDIELNTELGIDKVVENMKRHPESYPIIKELNIDTKKLRAVHNGNKHYIEFICNDGSSDVSGFSVRPERLYRTMDSTTESVFSFKDGKHFVRKEKINTTTNKKEYNIIGVIFINGNTDLDKNFIYYHELGHLVTNQESIREYFYTNTTNNNSKNLKDNKGYLAYLNTPFHSSFSEAFTYFEDPIEVRADAYANLRYSFSIKQLINYYSSNRRFVFHSLFPHIYEQNLKKELAYVGSLPEIGLFGKFRAKFSKLNVDEKYKNSERTDRITTSFSKKYRTEFEWLGNNYETYIIDNKDFKGYKEAFEKEFNKKCEDYE